MDKKEQRQINILIGAFKLFLSKEYADVVTADLEEITGVTRGAIYYKVKNKEGLYKAVVDKFIFEPISAYVNRDISTSKDSPFWDFLVSELELVRDRMNTIKRLNIGATSAQFFSLLTSANFHYYGFNNKCKELEKEILDFWLKYYRKGVEAGELRGSLNPQLIISMFRSLYYGDAFYLSIAGGELNIEELKNKYSLLYNAIHL